MKFDATLWDHSFFKNQILGILLSGKALELPKDKEKVFVLSCETRYCLREFWIQDNQTDNHAVVHLYEIPAMQTNKITLPVYDCITRIY